jgi:hypothetical protein
MNTNRGADTMPSTKPTPAELIATLNLDLAKLGVDRQIERRNQMHAIEAFDAEIRAEQREDAEYAQVPAPPKRESLFDATGQGRC